MKSSTRQVFSSYPGQQLLRGLDAVLSLSEGALALVDPEYTPYGSDARKQKMEEEEASGVAPESDDEVSLQKTLQLRPLQFIYLSYELRR